MNPSTALATVLVDELVLGGVTDAVLAPGSRSAPLAYALHAADAAGRLRLHVRIDERSAGFLALGLAKASGRAVPVVTTSGTATANLHPAVLEAAHTGTGLLLLTADRPPELRGTGANQTTDQLRLYGSAAAFVEVGTPEARPGQNASWRSLVCRALAAGGPVHLNLGFREPLVPGPGDWPESLAGRAGPWTSVRAPDRTAVPDDLPDRTVVVLGDGAEGGDAHAAQRLAAHRGWPVVAEPSSGAALDPHVLAVPDLVLGTAGFLDAHRPDRVLVVGRPTLSRSVGRLIGGGPADVVPGAGRWSDPLSTAGRVLPQVPDLSGTGRDADWLPAWQRASATAAAAVAGVLDAAGLSEPAVARAVQRAVPDGGLLVVGSSKPVRDLLLAGPPRLAGTGDGWFAYAPLDTARPGPAVRVLANRGVAGIDGMVSTAVGAALAHGAPSYALMGDLTFLHDANGLVLGPSEPRPDLCVVVVNNDGGAIFGTLEQGVPELAGAFERVFGTPHGVDLAALCAATRTPHVLATTLAELGAALEPAPGLRVVEVQTDRAAAVALDARLHDAVQAALAQPAPPPRP